MPSITSIFPSYDGPSSSWQATFPGGLGLTDGDVLITLMIGQNSEAQGLPSALDSHAVSSSGGGWTSHVLDLWHDPAVDSGAGGYFEWGLWSKVWNTGGGDAPGDVWGFKNDAQNGVCIIIACQGVGAPTWHLGSEPGSFTGDPVHAPCGDGTFLDFTNIGGSGYHTDLLAGYFDLGTMIVDAGVLWGGGQSPSSPKFTLAGTEDDHNSGAGPGGLSDSTYWLNLTDYFAGSPRRISGAFGVSG